MSAPRPSSIEVLRHNLKRFRAIRGLTQRQLAQQAGIGYKHIQKIEGNRWLGVQLSTIEKLAAGLGIATWVLLRPDRSYHSTSPNSEGSLNAPSGASTPGNPSA